MKKKLLLFLAYGICNFGFSQECPDLIAPTDGEVNVPVDATITWEVVPGIPSYRILLGRTPGASDLATVTVGSATSYTPAQGLPESTQIFVTIVLDFFQGQEDIVCDAQSFTTAEVTTPPDCTSLRLPEDGATDVSVFSNVVWNYAPTATNYDVIIGTQPGLGDIVNTNVTDLRINPPGEFPENSEMYVQIIPRNENGSAQNCTEFSFTTRELAPLPGCTRLVSPLDGDINVALTPFLEWVPVPEATRYRVTLGTTPTENDVLDNAVFTTNSTFVLNFEPNRTFFITIVPFNESGDAIGCGQESFSTILGCGPFLDRATGELVTLGPDLELPDVFSFCENGDSLRIAAPEGADGYRWFRIDQFDNEVFLSEDTEITINALGDYFLEAYTLVSQPGGLIECPIFLEFTVIASEIATIEGLDIRDTNLGLDITVQVSGTGDYEYAIDNIDGPYQDDTAFREIAPGTHTIYVRDKNGCGIAQETFEQNLIVEGFPKFFTPNGDSFNQYWQFKQPQEGEPVALVSIQIYDRFGRLLSEFSSDAPGWDGTVNGRPLPSGGYWFRAIDDENKVFKGFFTLKR